MTIKQKTEVRKVLDGFFAENSLLGDFLQPGLILIIFGLLMLVVPEKIRKAIVVLG